MSAEQELFRALAGKQDINHYYALLLTVTSSLLKTYLCSKIEHVDSKDSHCDSENWYFRSMKSTKLADTRVLERLMPVLDELGSFLFLVKIKKADTCSFVFVCMLSSWKCQAVYFLLVSMHPLCWLRETLGKASLSRDTYSHLQ